MSGADDQRGTEPDQCRYCPNDADRDEAGFLHCIECRWTDNPGKIVGLYESLDRLRAELAETRDRRDYLQGQLDIIYDAEYSRNDAQPSAERLPVDEILTVELPRALPVRVPTTDGGTTVIGAGRLADRPELDARWDEHSESWAAPAVARTDGQPPAGDTAAPDVQVWQSDDGDWGWACAGCDYRSVAWWSDRAVAERGAVEHGRDHCPARGSAPASTDGDQ